MCTPRMVAMMVGEDDQRDPGLAAFGGGKHGEQVVIMPWARVDDDRGTGVTRGDDQPGIRAIEGHRAGVFDP